VSRRHRLAQNRDVTLTTLIDLLVQIIFVLALILVSADVMGNESRERGWVTPEAWKTLISIFDVDPRTLRDVPAQVAAIKSTYTRMKDDLHACDARTGACDRQAGRGPGNPPCRNSAGVEMVVANATIDRDGGILLAQHPSCAFKADVRYDARAQAGDYEPARRAIASYFTLSTSPRRF
jgi:hypothetical protein